MTEEQLIAAKDAAELIGISPDLLREWSQDDLFGPYFAAPKKSGRRRYTNRDVAIGKVIRELHEHEGLTYRQVLQRINTQGVEQLLHAYIGSEQHTQVLAEEKSRLEARVSELLIQTAKLQNYASLWQQARANGAALLSDLQARQVAAERDLELLEANQQTTARHLKAARQELTQISFWSWIFGGRQKALLHLEEAEHTYRLATERVLAMREAINEVPTSQIRRLLKLDPEEVIDVIASNK